jgi:hypothetical protein
MYENRAAFIRFTTKDYDFVQGTWTEHPYYLPDFQNVFKFSLAFLAENGLSSLFTLIYFILFLSDIHHLFILTNIVLEKKNPSYEVHDEYSRCLQSGS